jgi:hypothetical protein
VWEQDTRKTTWYIELGLAAAVTACEAPLPGTCVRCRAPAAPLPRARWQACAAAARPAATRYHFEARSGRIRQRSPPAACTPQTGDTCSRAPPPAAAALISSSAAVVSWSPVALGPPAAVVGCCCCCLWVCTGRVARASCCGRPEKYHAQEKELVQLKREARLCSGFSGQASVCGSHLVEKLETR